MKLFNKTTNSPLASKVKIADTFSSRLIGLLNRSVLLEGEALVITRCQSIHMFFMRFAIDVVFVDAENKVVGLVKNIKPFQLSPIFFKATSAIELPSGSIDKTKTSLGDWIKWQD